MYMSAIANRSGIDADVEGASSKENASATRLNIYLSVSIYELHAEINKQWEYRNAARSDCA